MMYNVIMYYVIVMQIIQYNSISVALIKFNIIEYSGMLK